MKILFVSSLFALLAQGALAQEVGGDAEVTNTVDGNAIAITAGADAMAIAGAVSVCGTIDGDLEVTNFVDGHVVAMAAGNRSEAVAGSVVLGSEDCD